LGGRPLAPVARGRIGRADPQGPRHLLDPAPVVGTAHLCGPRRLRHRNSVDRDAGGVASLSFRPSRLGGECRNPYPQRWDYGFRVRGLAPAPRNDQPEFRRYRPSRCSIRAAMSWSAGAAEVFNAAMTPRRSGSARFWLSFALPSIDSIVSRRPTMPLSWLRT